MLRMTLTAAVMAASALFATERFYLEPEQIAFTDEMIFVQLDDAIIEVDHLLLDQNGLFLAQRGAPTIKEAPKDCHKRLNPKNTCHKKLNPKNTCGIS